MTEPLFPPPPGGSTAPADLGTALQAVLLAQLYGIDEHLKHRGRHPHRAVHEVRKAVRRFRSVLALCSSVDADALDRLEGRIRVIGKKLSRLRDAHVVMETASATRRQDEDAEIWRDLRAVLKKERDTLLAQMLEDDPGFARLRKRALAAARKIAGMSFRTLTCEAVVLALRETAARMHKAERDAKDSRRATIRHRWRKRIRRLRLQLECIQEIVRDDMTPAMVRAEARWVLNEALATMPSAETLTQLADKLGAQQDVAHLKTALRRQENLPLRDALLRSLKRRRSH